MDQLLAWLKDYGRMVRERIATNSVSDIHYETKWNKTQLGAMFRAACMSSPVCVRSESQWCYWRYPARLTRVEPSLQNTPRMRTRIRRVSPVFRRSADPVDLLRFLQNMDRTNQRPIRPPRHSGHKPPPRTFLPAQIPYFVA